MSKKPAFKKNRIISGREYRRMTEREDKREEKLRRMEEFMQLPAEERAKLREVNEAVQRIERNGLTIEDLKKNYQIGWDAGFKDAKDFTLKVCFAGVCLALNEKYGFGQKRCIEVLREIDKKMMYALSSEDALDEVFEKLKIKMHFGETFSEDRITEQEA